MDLGSRPFSDSPAVEISRVRGMDLGIYLLFHLIFILGFCFCDLLLPLLVHFFLQFFLFSKALNIKGSSKSYLNKSHKEQQSMIKGTALTFHMFLSVSLAGCSDTPLLHLSASELAGKKTPKK